MHNNNNVMITIKNTYFENLVSCMYIYYIYSYKCKISAKNIKCIYII